MSMAYLSGSGNFMGRFTRTGTREEKVVRILESSRKIEDTIKVSYQKVFIKVARHPSVREEQMPIFVSFLYDLIIEMGELPSNREFIKRYLEAYYEETDQNSMIYNARLYRIHNAYCALVRDLHFYFKLSESKKFSNVLLNYAYDIEAKQDLVVTYGDKKLGLQLFSGNDLSIPMKKKQTARRRIKLGYPDLFLPLHGSQASPINIGTENSPFYAYSSRDVELVLRELSLETTNSMDGVEEKYIFPKDLRQEETFPAPKLEDSSIEVKKEAKHSYVYVGDETLEENAARIDAMLKRGLRVEWISPHKEDNRENVRVHIWQYAKQYPMEITDGVLNEEERNVLKEIGKFSSFNFEQYVTEHASINKHLMVEAGAGSGKTETIISRIIYLLHLNLVQSLDEIVMITFTNEATDIMKIKLSKRLFQLFKLTSNIRYFEWNEQVASMRILTIPSFSRSLIQDFSAQIGMSKNFAVRPLTLKREEIIAEILDQYITENELSYESLGQLRDFEIIKMVNNFWGQLEQKGIVLDNYKKIQWGEPPRENMEKRYYHLFKKVLEECEKRFSEEKLKNDVFTVNDLTQKINNIEPFMDSDNLSQPFRFLFIDEFQDTDDVQIDLIKKLTDITNAQLFVVGDIKQSIYRFRGANYTAFDELSGKIGEDRVDRNFNLKKNYRTSSVILQNLENIFDVWRNDKREILPKAVSKLGEEEGRLIPVIKREKYKKPYKMDTSIHDISIELLKLFQTMIRDEEQIEKNKPVELAILVRSNYQAEEMRRMLEKLRQSNSEIVYEVVTGGSLFGSKAAKDLLILLNALSYERDPESFYALHQTAFSMKSFNPVPLISLKGDKEKLLENLTYSDVIGFSEALVNLRIKPIINVIYKFLSMNPYEEVLHKQNTQLHDIQKYQLNVYRILELASESFTHTIMNMHQLRDWLSIQVATNRNEDETEVDIVNCEKLIKVMTVHKAKGLEFDTVFIPYTDQALVKKPKQNLVVLRERATIHVAWKTKVEEETKKEISSTNYEAINNIEEQESIREEARLLYVALTRAKQRLVVNCVKPKYPNNTLFNWSELIRHGKEGV
ncbi:UvrD-helicase domain-containing protein [Rossellomorea vietnamensis]|uniref:UvrD-helicase domain-containing protein n=1 Tax=Rossellomorea vietnamensis TaxID=218284 RepID=UPI003D2E96C7